MVLHIRKVYPKHLGKRNRDSAIRIVEEYNGKPAIIRDADNGSFFGIIKKLDKNKKTYELCPFDSSAESCQEPDKENKLLRYDRLEEMMIAFLSPKDSQDYSSKFYLYCDIE